MEHPAHTPTGDTIDLTSSFDRIFWRHHFRTTDDTLKEAVNTVGPRVEDVADYLREKLGEPSVNN